MSSYSQSKKISELETLQSIVSINRNKDNTWIPAALYDTVNNTYKNVAIKLQSITNYCNSYSSYLYTNIEERLNKCEQSTQNILNSYLAYISYGNITPSSYIMSYCSAYASTMINEAVDKISNNMITLINNIKNKPSNSYVRSNSKKISELKGRETITTYQDHSWFAVAQYDQRINAYHNIAINLKTITSYSTSYTSYVMSYNMNVVDLKLQELSDDLINQNITYTTESLAFKYLEDGYTPQISLDDIKDLAIDKKLVTLNSNDYTEEAFEYIKQLVFEKDAILFDTANHLIWTLNSHFGSDVLKKDLLYYSTINKIDDIDNIIDTLNAKGPEQTLSLKQNNGIKISFSKDDEINKDIISFELSLNEIIRENYSDKYFLYIDENNKIGIKEYRKPIITINSIEHIEDNIIELPFEIDSVVPVDQWPTFEISGKNCNIIEIDNDRNIIKVEINTENYMNNINENIIFVYDDRYSHGKIIIDHIFKSYCYYGCVFDDYIILGQYEILNDSIDNIITIDQQKKYYAFFRCPIKYSPCFIDNKRQVQGVWKKDSVDIINDKIYHTYSTQHSGLGNIEWHIVENIK